MTTNSTYLRSRLVRRIAAVVFVATTLSAAFFGLRTYGSFLLLRSAYEAGAPMTSSIRAWMTLGYVATTFRTSDAALIERLGLAPETDPNASLKSLAEQAGVSPPLTPGASSARSPT